MPFFNEQKNFWEEYREHYNSSLVKEEKSNLAVFDELFMNVSASGPPHSLSPAACRAALFITLYRGYPVLQLPFQLLNTLLEIDVQLSSWRYRHMNMVHRMIGTRIGTGGSSGKDYLRAAAEKHYIFKDIARLNSFLIERRRLPVLNPVMEKKLGFAVNG
jgi:tryptophan 2,3-dioxygenase